VSQILTASDQLSQTAETLSSGAVEQASQVEETASSMEELASMVKLTSDNSSQSSLLSNTALELTDQGNLEMENMLKAMKEISQSSDEIRNVIDVIEDIAFQTNMLALNASVEAARAGEVGMGFAVVADEVKNLARRSSENAKEIARMIKESIGRTEIGIRSAKSLSGTFQNILTNVRKVNQMNREIESASHQQETGIRQITTAISQFDSVVQSNASNAEETSASASDLRIRSNILTDITGQLLMLVTGLKKQQGRS
jgi:methyl-accepting chemotaxis protein